MNERTPVFNQDTSDLMAVAYATEEYRRPPTTKQASDEAITEPTGVTLEEEKPSLKRKVGTALAIVAALAGGLKIVDLGLDAVEAQATHNEQVGIEYTQKANDLEAQINDGFINISPATSANKNS